MAPETLTAVTAWSTVGLVVVTFALVVVTGLLVWQTWKYTKHTKDQADAAKALVDELDEQRREAMSAHLVLTSGHVMRESAGTRISYLLSNNRTAVAHLVQSRSRIEGASEGSSVGFDVTAAEGRPYRVCREVELGGSILLADGPAVPNGGAPTLVMCFEDAAGPHEWKWEVRPDEEQGKVFNLVEMDGKAVEDTVAEN